MPRRENNSQCGGRLRPGAALLAALVLVPAVGQHLSVGSTAPLPALRDLTGAERPLKGLVGSHGLILLFWAGWSQRSVEELKRLDVMRPDIAERGVNVVAVNVEHQTLTPEMLQGLQDQVSQLAISTPVVVDEGLELFHAFGVVSVPSTALVDAKGELVAFTPGYGHLAREQLFDAIDRLADIKRAWPVVALPAVPPAVLRRLQLGRAQLATQRVAAARATFEAVADAEPTFADPLVEIAALAIDDGDTARADDLLARALALEPRHPAAARERARADFVAGRVEDARAALEQLTGTDAVDPMANAYLGFLLDHAGEKEAAAAAFDRATGAGAADPRVAVPRGSPAAAMVAYRRASAAVR